MIECPQCGAQAPDDAWNCPSCRVNLYWARQHFEELARIRSEQGIPVEASTPPFLRQVHQKEMEERMARGLPPENNVRKLARKIILGEKD